jgi:glucose-6-phosphate 1-dehydrogenase
VPFYVRSGKRLQAKTSEIVLHMKKPPHIPFALPEEPKADRLVLRLVPNEGISLRFNAKRPGQKIELSRVSLDFLYDEQFERPTPDAYETLLMDIMRGDPTLFMRADEVEEQWRIVEPLLRAWETSDQEPAFYPAGSWGPREADELLARQGRTWHPPHTNKGGDA